MYFTKDSRRFARLPSFPVRSRQRAPFFQSAQTRFFEKFSKVNKEPNILSNLTFLYFKYSKKKNCSRLKTFCKRRGICHTATENTGTQGTEESSLSVSQYPYRAKRPSKRSCKCTCYSTVMRYLFADRLVISYSYHHATSADSNVCGRYH